ncbi:unnamed protein product [Caenorhabditis auriculariae]|uniref:SLC12A transporter C-terminal domain-containing protein n=1 Tax=Caenorhabditis auriculariae TaxID=2777116 RepID=A0A8S1GS98_9PELO|nr:unnamed protein product [Caenorhabditis auriculariae]
MAQTAGGAVSSQATGRANYLSSEKARESNDEEAIDVTTSYRWRDVFVRVAQPMLAVVLLFRFSHVIDEVGVAVATLIVLLSFTIALVTGWTTCITASKHHSEHGFLRTMVAATSTEVGISLSVLFVFCCCMAISAFISAASEAVMHILSMFSFEPIDGANHDLRLISAVLCLIILGLSTLRMRHSGTVRTFVFALTFLAIFLYLSGALFHYGDYVLRKVPEVNQLISSPSLNDSGNLFAVLFPSAICTLSLLSMNRKIQGSAPRGCLLAVLVGVITYVVAALSEKIEVFSIGPARHNATLEGVWAFYYYTTVPIALGVILGGALSALTFLHYASRIVQSLGRCQHFGRLLCLSRGYGHDDIPFRALLSVTCISVLISMIGSYDVLCIPTSCFFLVVYALFNFYAFRAKSKDSESPLPPPIVSLLTSAGCILLSLHISRWVTTLPVFIFILAYSYLLYAYRERKEGDFEKRSNFVPTLQGVYELSEEPESERRYRPQILLLTGNPAARPGLVDFTHSITKGETLLICGYVVQQPPGTRSYLLTQKLEKQMSEWFIRREIAAFGATICSPGQADGVATLLQTVGLGRIRPNVLMLGFKRNWETGLDKLAQNNEYYSMLTNAFEKQVGLAIFRNQNSGFDLSAAIRKTSDGEIVQGDKEIAEFVESTNVSLNEEPIKKGQRAKLFNSVQGALRKVSRVGMGRTVQDPEIGVKVNPTVTTEADKNRFEVIPKYSISAPDQKHINDQMHRFRKSVPHGRIDVWWLREAGGLTMLLPHLLTQNNSYLEGAQIRVFTKGSVQESKVNEEQKRMTSLLRKFNIDSSDLHILPDFKQPPSAATLNMFNQFLEPFKVRRGEEKSPGQVDEDDLFNFREKTKDYLRAVELMAEHSQTSDLVVVTLPSARPEIPSSLYLAWTEMLSRRSTPTLLVRGNQLNPSSMNYK